MIRTQIQHTSPLAPGVRAGVKGGSPRGSRGQRRLEATVRRAGRAASGLRALLIGLWILALLAPAAARAASQGDLIVNQASLLSAGATQVSTSVTATVVVRTTSTVEFLKYAPAASDGSLPPGTTLVNVDPTWYRTGSSDQSPFAVLAAPTPLGSTTPLDLANPVPLVKTNSYHAGEPVFVRVTDLDQNLDRAVRETITVTVKNSTTGETEVLRLTETGPDTGVFVGYVPSQEATGSGSPSYNGVLPVSQGSPLDARYVDTVDGSDTSADSVVVDPLGIVFDSVTGKPIDGVTVTLFDVTHNRAATVFGDDG